MHARVNVCGPPSYMCSSSAFVAGFTKRPTRELSMKKWMRDHFLGATTSDWRSLWLQLSGSIRSHCGDRSNSTQQLIELNDFKRDWAVQRIVDFVKRWWRIPLRVIGIQACLCDHTQPVLIAPYNEVVISVQIWTDPQIGFQLTVADSNIFTNILVCV